MRATKIDSIRGKYHNTCDTCGLVSVRKADDTTCYLQCECRDTNGHKKTSKIDLSKHWNFWTTESLAHINR